MNTIISHLMYTIAMKADKTQFAAFLQEKEEMIERLRKMVPENREDYPLLAGEIKAMAEIESNMKTMTMDTLVRWLKEEKEKNEKMIRGYEESEYPLAGRTVIFRECLTWLKKDHRTIVNHIYLS